MNTKNLLETFQFGNLPLEWPGHWIGGSFRHAKLSGEQKTSINPNNGKELLHFSTSKQVIDDAIDAAITAFAEIRNWPLDRRMELLNKFKNSFADHRSLFKKALQLEAGKPAWEANADIDAAYHYLEKVISAKNQIEEGLLASAKLGQNASFQLHPVGICAAYLPFSTPVTSFVIYYSSALIAGCPLILFSSTHATLVSLIVSAIDNQNASPKGVLGVVFSGFKNFKYALSNHSVAAVLYTGSYEHCAEIYRDYKGPFHRQLVLQSGGKNSVIVHSTADLDKAVYSILYGACKATGQLCSSTSRVFVYRSLMPQLAERLQRAIQTMEINRTDLSEPGPFMGPIFSKKGLEKFLRFQTMANREARETIVWGRVIESENTNNGYFVTPGVHVMESFDSKSAYQGNVLFCPDIALYHYDVLDEAIACINDTQATLSVSFFGDSEILISRSHLFQAPNLLVNQPTVEIEACLPLAGRTQYGRHRYQGIALAWYLSYPQAIDTNDKKMELLEDIPPLI